MLSQFLVALEDLLGARKTLSCEVRRLAVRSALLVERREFELPVLFWFLTLTKGLELRTAYEHRMAEGERSVRCVQLGLRRPSSSVVRAALRIAAGQLLERGNRGDLLWIALLIESHKRRIRGLDFGRESSLCRARRRMAHETTRDFPSSAN